MLRLLLSPLLLFAATSYAAEPPVGDEVSFLELKSRPEKYVGKVFVLAGKIEIDDYYWGAYDGKSASHSCFMLISGDEHVYLYITKDKSSSLVDAVLKNKEAKREVRVKVLLSMAAYHQEPHWDTLEVGAIQFAKADDSGWEPWVGAGASGRNVHQAAAQKDADGRRARAIAAQQDRAAKYAAAVAEPRTWTISDGTKIDARFCGVISGKVKLTLADKSVQYVLLDDLSDDDRTWISDLRK